MVVLVGFWVVLLRRRVVLLEVVVEGSLDGVGVHQVIVRVWLPQDTLGLVTSSQGVRLVRGRGVHNLQLDRYNHLHRIKCSRIPCQYFSTGPRHTGRR